MSELQSRDQTLDELIKESKERLAAMSPDEREEMYRKQRESFVRAMNTPCEHGVLDFEQCAECRKDCALQSEER